MNTGVWIVDVVPARSTSEHGGMDSRCSDSEEQDEHEGMDVGVNLQTNVDSER